MARVVSLYFPTWPTDRLRRKLGPAAPPADTPVIMFGHRGSARQVLALDKIATQTGSCRHARQQGPASRARSRSLELEPDEDIAALERLAVWALRYAPLVAADPPDGLVIDATGSDHLFGGEQEMLEDMIGRISSAGIVAQAAIADGWGAAHAFARYVARPTFRSNPGDDAVLMRDLPLAALRLPWKLLDDLHTLGFERVENLDDTPPAPLTQRFGPEVRRRLDHAMGRAAELFEPVRTAELVEVRRSFGEPIGAPETITRYIAKLTEQLCEQLELKGLGARRLDLLFHRVDNRIEAIRAGMAMPVRDPRRLARLLTDRLESIDPGFGIELMVLAATLVEPLHSRQAASSLIDPPEPDISDLLDVISNRLGEDRLYRFAPVESDVPERSVRRVPPASPDSGANWQSDWPRPSRLLSPPEAIETMALLPDNPPVWFTWRGIRRRVARADGPERIFGEWWSRDAEMQAVRDYFQVEDDSGERFWIFRAGDGEDAQTGSHRWFLHGIFA